MVDKFIKYKIYTFLSKCFNKLVNISLYSCRKFNDFKNISIENKLKDYLRMAYKCTPDNNKYDSRRFTNVIWVFWWQGLKEAPIIVKKCINSIKLHSGDFKVILITKYNIKKYTDIPYYIYRKVNNNCITLTHFSDILRYNLLKNNGGLWIDATNYCTSDLKSSDFNRMDPFTTVGENSDGGTLYINGRNKCHQWISGKWTGFLIGGNKGNSLFYFMSYFFDLYWKYNNVLINYNLVDYVLYYAYKHNIGNFRYSVNNTSFNNLDKYELNNNLSNLYNYDLYKKISSNTKLFKLSYKINNMRTNKDTFYNRIITNKLGKK